MTALGIRYLRGYAVASDVARQRPEWPPHPGRVFMALAAAHFETGEDPAERRALEWLEREDAPALSASEARHRSFVETYVPANDKTGGIVSRGRHPRAFPTVRPDKDSLFLIWRSDTPSDVDSALRQLCHKVTRIGHSSSLVQMWVASETEVPVPNWLPSELGAVARMRTANKGTLHYLERTFAKADFASYSAMIEVFNAANGKEKTRLKKELERTFPNGAPVVARPLLSTWQGYKQSAASSDGAEPAMEGPFDSRLLIFSKFEGTSLGLETTQQLAGALRNAAMKALKDDVPEWLSGHQPDGAPTTRSHAAFFPLPFVGAPYADGHLMGIAMALPRNVPEKELAQVVGSLLFTESGEERRIHLWNKLVWKWTVERERRPHPPAALNAHTWTDASRKWASVTPIVLHHYPKKTREADVERIVREAFQSALLPDPIGVEVTPVSVYQGVGHVRSMPEYGEGGAGLCRYQVHSVVEFDRPLQGPVLVGRGRFRGYGLFRPLQEQIHGRS